MGGCIASKESASAGTADAAKDAGTSKTGGSEGMRLLEEYSVGQTLGEGAFGVVSNCKHRITGIEYAVKMVDKVETPVDQIKKEAAMLESLDHPNIVKFHGVYYERCFVCIVMDKYGGGDLVEGLQKHLKERGQINCFHVVHVARQMGASVEHLHSRGVIHRDVKGDNYLMDRRDMTDPGCKVVLTDFGTACHVEPSERLSAAVGTKIFWAPEFFDKNYGKKVDVWAIGVIMYGLVTGRFPFRDEADIRTKEVKIPKRVHARCEEFVKKMLEKKEALRFDAAQMMGHAWLADGSKKEDKTDSKQSVPDGEEAPTEDFRVDQANEGIQERRQELINRLNKEHEGRTAPKGVTASATAKHADSARFTLRDKTGATMVYEWWDKDKAKRANIHEIDDVSSSTDLKGAGFNLETFESMLKEHNIDISKFGVGKAKTLPQMGQEVESGAARLMLDAAEHKKLVRVCDLVVLVLQSPNDPEKRMIIETDEKFPDGRQRETNRLPGTKKEPYENTRQTAERILKGFMKIDPRSVNLDLLKIVRVEEEIESPSFPGVTSVYRKEIVEGTISISDPDLLKKVGLPTYSNWEATDDVGNLKYFKWMTAKQAEEKKVKLTPEKQEVSTLVKAPIGLSEEALKQQLTKAGIDVSKYGSPGTKTLKEFSAELIKGESTLVQDGAGSTIRVVDVVVLIIQRRNGQEVLVQTKQADPHGKETILNRLPGAKRRPDENQFLSARRIIRRQLEMDENQVVFDENVKHVEEDKASNTYPGLKTVYRKRIISASWSSTGS